MNEQMAHHHHPSPLPLFRLWLCGPFQAERCNGTTYDLLPLKAWGGSNDPRRLLKRLLCSPRRQVRRGELLESLWPEIDPDLSRGYLNDAVYRLRAALCPNKETKSLLITSDDHGSLHLPEQALLWVDADAALSLLTQAEASKQNGNDPFLLVDEAVHYLARGEFLEDEEGIWAHGRRGTLERARHGSLLWLARLYQQRGSLRQAETLLNALLEQDAMDEDALCVLMTNLHLQQRTSEAFRLFEQTARLLHENGLEVAASTKELIERVRNGPLPPTECLLESSPSTLSSQLGATEAAKRFIQANYPIRFPLFSIPPVFNMSQESNLDLMRSHRQMLHDLLMLASTILIVSPSMTWAFQEDEPLAVSVTGAALDDLESITSRYWRLCKNASLDLLGNLLEHFQTIIHLLRQPQPTEISSRLFSLAGECTQLLGKTLFDLQEYMLAWFYYAFSLKGAQAASNHELWATGLGRLSLLLIYWKYPQGALPFLQEARQLTIQGSRICGWLAAIEAEVHAYLGDVEACDAALMRAKAFIASEVLEEDRYATGSRPTSIAASSNIARSQDHSATINIVRRHRACLCTAGKCPTGE